MSARKMDLDAERALLGAIVLSDQVLKAVTMDEGLRVEHFGSPRNQVAFATMNGLAERGEPIDGVTLLVELRRLGKLAEVGGEYELSQITTMNGSPGSARAYARRIIELARWRKVTDAAQMLLDAADTEDQSLVDKAELVLRPDESVDSLSFEDEVYDYLAAGKDTGVPWPFRRLAQFAGGNMQPKECTLIGGFSGIGKSVWLDQMLEVGSKHGANVLLYLNEGGRVDRGLRYISRDTGIPYEDLRMRRLTAAQTQEAVKACSSGFPFAAKDVTGWTAPDVARDMRWDQRDLYAIDIVHELQHADERELAELWRVLRHGAASRGAHLVATAHLNEGRATSEKLPTPVLRDLRGSGMLKNSSDNVMFLHREHVVEDGRVRMTNDAAVWFAKCRHGYHDGMGLVFDPVRLRFMLPAREDF